MDLFSDEPLPVPTFDSSTKRGLYGGPCVDRTQDHTVLPPSTLDLSLRPRTARSRTPESVEKKNKSTGRGEKGEEDVSSGTLEKGSGR